MARQCNESASGPWERPVGGGGDEWRHFLKRGLKLCAWEEPERAYQIEGKDFGTLYHAVAHRL